MSRRKDNNGFPSESHIQEAAPVGPSVNQPVSKQIKLHAIVSIGFSINFEKMMAVSNCNKINVYTAREFTLIDILTGHKSPIKCLDVSPLTKDIISFSKDKIILHRVHEMKENPTFYSDQTIMTSALGWDAVWKLELFLPINFLKFSTIGDFFVATGTEIFNIWRKDHSTPFFSSELFFSVDKTIAIPSKKTEFLTSTELGEFIQ